MSSQQLSHDLYKWLAPLEILPSHLRYKSNGNFELDTKTTDNLLNGYLVAKLIMQLANQNGAVVNQPLLSSIKQSNTPAARTYNWNIISESFLKLNITISKQTQKEIISGNFPTLVRFLLDLNKRFNTKKNEIKNDEPKSQINLKKLQAMQSFEEAESFLQMVIMIISENLNLTPKQTLSTLSENAKYYAHMVVKGIKNSFEEILNMLAFFIKEISKLMFQCEKSPEKNTQFFLDLIKPTLISRELEVAKKGSQLFRVFIDESLKYNSKNIIYQILCKENVGFDFLYMALKRHPDLITDFTSFIFPLIRQAFKDFFEVHLKRTINNQQQYVKILLKLLEGLSVDPESKIKIKQSGLLEVWLKNSQQSFNNKKNKQQTLINQETKLLYLQLLCNLWKQYSSEINEEQAQQLLMRGIEQLKKNVRKEIYTVKIPALLRLFDFLHYLADAKNKVASILYKKLIFLFIQNHDEEQIREIILENFIVMSKKYPTIPIQFLLEPFLRQLINSEGKSYTLNIFDFQILIELCKHPRMDAAHGLSYLEYFSKLYIKSIIYSKLIIRIIQILTNRFCEQEAIIQFMKKNLESTLNLYGILIFNKKKLSKQDSIINKQKKSLVIQLIKHFIKLDHRQLNQFILSKITQLYLSWIQEKNYTDKGIKYLISIYGDVDQICLQFKIHQNRKFENQTPVSSQSIESDSNQNQLSKPTPKSQAYKQRQYMKDNGIGYKIKNNTSKARLEQLIEKSSLKPNPKVLQDIQKLKEKMKEDANKKKKLQNIEMRKLVQQNNQNSIELLHRNISLGYSKLTPFQQDKIIFDFDSVKPKQLKLLTKFHQLNELQVCDQKSTNIVLKQYAKEIKSLFLKYALISSASEMRRQETNPIMSFTEIIKMIKEKNISNISKLGVSDMIVLINHNKRKQKNVLSGIQESDFNQFLIKLTDYIIQEERSSVELPFGLKLEVVLKTLFIGENFYENKFRIKDPPNIIKLREAIKLGQLQNEQIPQGYKKVKESHVDLQYRVIQNNWGIASKMQVGYEITDWLINKCLGFHIMTPYVEIKQRSNLIQIPKAIKPRMSKNQTDPKIKYENQEPKVEGALVKNPNQKLSKGSKKTIKKQPSSDNRSLSQKAMHNKTKTDPIEQQQQQKLKALKHLKYVEKLKQNLEKLRSQKNTKQQEERLKNQEQKKKEKKKQQQQYKKYLQINKQKIKQQKLKNQQENFKKQESQKLQKQRLKQETKKRNQEFLEKHKDAIKLKAEKINQKKKDIQNSLEKKAQNLEKLAKEVIGSKNETQNQKIKMLEVKNSIENGNLKPIVSKYEKQLTQLFQNYWIWDKKRIQLNSFALMLKDFHISPELVYPKTLSETYKSISKGQTLDYEGFVECLVKCGYKSQKLAQEYPGLQGQQQVKINEGVIKQLFQRLKFKQPNYREIIKQTKDHLI